LWETETGRLLREFKAAMTDVISVGFTPDGIQAFTASRSGYVFLWRVAGDQPPIVYDVHASGTLSCAQLSANGRYLLTCSSDGTARLWTLGTPDPPKLLKLNSPILSGVFSADMAQTPYVLLGGPSSNVTVWWYTLDAQSSIKVFDSPGQPVKLMTTNNLDYIGFGGGTTRPAFINHGELDVSNNVLPVAADVRSEVLTVDGSGLTAMAGTGGLMFALSFSSNSVVELYASNPGGMILQAGRLIATATGHSAAVTSIVFGSNKKAQYMLTGSLDTTVRLWDITHPSDNPLQNTVRLKELRQYKLPYAAPKS